VRKLSNVEKQRKAIAEMISSLLRVASDHSKSLADVGLVIQVSSDSSKGYFSAQICHPPSEAEEKPEFSRE